MIQLRFPYDFTAICRLFAIFAASGPPEPTDFDTKYKHILSVMVNYIGN